MIFKQFYILQELRSRGKLSTGQVKESSDSSAAAFSTDLSKSLVVLIIRYITSLWKKIGRRNKYNLAIQNIVAKKHINLHFESKPLSK